MTLKMAQSAIFKVIYVPLGCKNVDRKGQCWELDGASPKKMTCPLRGQVIFLGLWF